MKHPRNSPPSTPGRVSNNTRLPFGVSSASAIFQRMMEGFLQGIPNVSVYLDDILIIGKTERDHLAILEETL